MPVFADMQESTFHVDINRAVEVLRKRPAFPEPSAFSRAEPTLRTDLER